MHRVYSTAVLLQRTSGAAQQQTLCRLRLYMHVDAARSLLAGSTGAHLSYSRVQFITLITTWTSTPFVYNIYIVYNIRVRVRLFVYRNNNRERRNV